MAKNASKLWTTSSYMSARHIRTPKSNQNKRLNVINVMGREFKRVYSKYEQHHLGKLNQWGNVLDKLLIPGLGLIDILCLYLLFCLNVALSIFRLRRNFCHFSCELFHRRMNPTTIIYWTFHNDVPSERFITAALLTKLYVTNTYTYCSPSLGQWQKVAAQVNTSDQSPQASISHCYG